MIRLIQLVHILVIIFVLGAWLVPMQSVRVAHLIFIPLMLLQWKINKDRCLLTDAESVFKGAPISEMGFIERLLARFGWRPPAKVICRINYSLPAIAWILSAVRTF